MTESEKLLCCLNCTKPECDCCLPFAKAVRYSHEKMERYMNGAAAGGKYTNRKIAELENVSRRTVIRWKKRYLAERGNQNA